MDSLDELSRSTGTPRMNRATAARHNRQLVLRLLGLHGRLSQSEIARRTGLQRSTIHYVISELRDRGLVHDGEIAAAHRVGPKEALIAMRPAAGWAAGLSLSSAGHRLSIVDASGAVVAQGGFEPRRTVQRFIDEVPDLLGAMAREQRLPRSSAMGLALCLPGIVNPETGYVLASRLLELKDFPLAARVRERLPGRIMVERSAVCGAYAEQYLGGRSAAEHFLYVIIRPEAGGTAGRQHYSFGLAMVSGGRVWRGAHSAAGELGRGGQFFGVAAEIDPRPITPAGRAALDQFLRQFGAGVGRLVNLFDPRLVVLAGDDRLCTEENLAPIRVAAHETITPIAGRELEIAVSTLGLEGPPRGAALLALHRGLVAKFETPLTR